MWAVGNRVVVTMPNYPSLRGRLGTVTSVQKLAETGCLRILLDGYKKPESFNVVYCDHAEKVI